MSTVTLYRISDVSGRGAHIGAGIVWIGSLRSKLREWFIENPERAESGKYVALSLDDSQQPVVFSFDVQVNKSIEVDITGVA